MHGSQGVALRMVVRSADTGDYATTVWCQSFLFLRCRMSDPQLSSRLRNLLERFKMNAPATATAIEAAEREAGLTFQIATRSSCSSLTVVKDRLAPTPIEIVAG